MMDRMNAQAGAGQPALHTPVSGGYCAFPEFGEPVPWFTAESLTNPDYKFHSVAGRYVLLAFVGAADTAEAEGAINALLAEADQFDDVRATAFIVVTDRAALERPSVKAAGEQLRLFIDHDLAISRQYGAAAMGNGDAPYRPYALLLDRSLRVLSRVAISRTDRMLASLGRLADPHDVSMGPDHAPVLLIPRVFEPELCRTLIDYYRKHDSHESGVMREIDGKTTLVLTPNFKRRRDCELTDPDLMAVTRERVAKRVVPEIRKAYQFQITRMERYLVARYAAGGEGFFRPHRDNTTKGTAHRKFALTINLNADDYDGGELRFAEYGMRTYKPPTGGACVFSCSMLHEATPVTRGERYCYLPFLYDDAGAAVREQNNAFLDDSVGTYKRSGAARTAAE